LYRCLGLRFGIPCLPLEYSDHRLESRLGHGFVWGHCIALCRYRMQDWLIPYLKKRSPYAAVKFK